MKELDLTPNESAQRLVDFLWTDDLLILDDPDDIYTEVDATSWAIRNLLAMEGFGVTEGKHVKDAEGVVHHFAKGRGAAYADMLFLGERGLGVTANLRDYRNCRKQKQANGTLACVKSSCGLVVRALWLLLGARDVDLLGPPFNGRHRGLLNPPYNPFGSIKGHPTNYTVIEAIERYAATRGAGPAFKKATSHRSGGLFFDEWEQTEQGETPKRVEQGIVKAGAPLIYPPRGKTSFSEEQLLALEPAPGDVFFIKSGGQHIFSLLGFREGVFVSVDGGTAGPLGLDSCCGIHRRKRKLTPEGILQTIPPRDGRPVLFVVKFERLVAAGGFGHAPVIQLVKNPAAMEGVRAHAPLGQDESDRDQGEDGPLEVAVRLVDPVSGEPLPNVEVIVSVPGQPPVARTTSDAQGEVRVEVPEAGDYVVTPVGGRQAFSFRAWDSAHRVLSNATVEVIDGGGQTLTFQTDDTGRFMGEELEAGSATFRCGELTILRHLNRGMTDEVRLLFARSTHA